MVNIAATKVVNMQYQRTLKKQEGLIRDPTSSIKVILWESYVDTLTLNSTYIFINLKVKLSKNKNERHLNTAKDVSFYAKKNCTIYSAINRCKQRVGKHGNINN